ncbi:MAG: hypothetical protein HQL97_03490 [Magnetococcales bacterium]|nr:hypothetical protein [Magnetococcales bacterium]
MHAGKLPGELSRRGLSSARKVWVAVDPEDEVVPGRLEARLRVLSTGLGDDEAIDALIESAREEVERVTEAVAHQNPFWT